MCQQQNSMSDKYDGNYPCRIIAPVFEALEALKWGKDWHQDCKRQLSILSPWSERQGFLSLSLEWGGWGKQRFHTCLLKVKLLSSSLRTSKIYFRIRALELPPKAYSQISDLDGCSVSRLKGLNPTVCHEHYSAPCPLLSLFALSQYFNAAKCRLHFRTPE